MPEETQTPVAEAEKPEAQVPETPAPSPDFGATEAEPKENEQAAEATEESEEKAPDESWETYYERLKDKEDFQAWREQETREHQRKGQIEGQRREAGQRKQVIDQLNQVNAGIAGLNSTLQRLQQEGVDGSAIAQAIAQYAPQWRALGEFTEERRQQFGDDVAKDNVAKAIYYAFIHPDVNNEELGQKYATRFIEEFEYDKGGEAFQDSVRDLVKAAKAEAVKPFQQKISRLEATIEELKGNSRKGQGPSAATGRADGRSEAEILADPKTPVSTLMEIRKRQRQGG